jgi:hypothetical protein
MRTIVVRYQSKPERADENQQLIEAVFAELNERGAKGFTYTVLRLEDGVSFIHIVTEHDGDEHDSLQAVPAFQAFVAQVDERCDILPVALGATVVGSHHGT